MTKGRQQKGWRSPMEGTFWNYKYFSPSWTYSEWIQALVRKGAEAESLKIFTLEAEKRITNTGCVMSPWTHLYRISIWWIGSCILIARMFRSWWFIHILIWSLCEIYHSLSTWCHVGLFISFFSLEPLAVLNLFIVSLTNPSHSYIGRGISILKGYQTFTLTSGCCCQS